MNGRMIEEITPEGRVAAAARSIATKMSKDFSNRHAHYQIPDYADFRDGLRIHIQRELLLARLEELGRWTGLGAIYKAHRQIELIRELSRLDVLVGLVAKK